MFGIGDSSISVPEAGLGFFSSRKTGVLHYVMSVYSADDASFGQWIPQAVRAALL